MTEIEKDFQKLTLKKWEKKRIDCPCHPTSIRAGKPFRIISQCGIATSACSFEFCPFIYWDCL